MLAARVSFPMGVNVFAYLLSVFLLLGATTWTVLVTPVATSPHRVHLVGGVLLAVTVVVLVGGVVYVLTDPQ